MSINNNHGIPKECRECPNWLEMRSRFRIVEVLEDAITKVKAKLESPDYKPSVADFLKLLEVQQELDRAEPKEIRVTWIDPPSKISK
jgi:hypothetical protein